MTDTTAELLAERIEIQPGIAKHIITFNRPEKLNAMTEVMLEMLDEELTKAENDPTIRVVILKAAGKRGFCAGLDLKEMDAYRARMEGPIPNVRRMYGIAFRMDVFPKPIISLVQGHCVGAGTQIACAADLIIASESARISEPEMRLGGFANDDWLRRIGHVLGQVRAKRYVLLTQPLTGREAEAVGLVSMTVPDDALEETGNSIADFLAVQKQATVERTLRLLDEGATGVPRSEWLKQARG